MKHLILGFCLLLISTPFGFTQEEVEVTSIHVWIAVERSKGPLTEKDFEVFEDGKKMTPTCFEKVNFAVPEPGASAAVDSSLQIPNGKKVAIFIDELNTSSGELDYIRPKIQEFLKQIDGKSEGMLVAFPPYEPMVPFTKDLDEIKSKLEDLTGNKTRDLDMTERRRRIELVLEYCCPRPIQKAMDMALQYQMEDTHNVQIFLDSLKSFSNFLSEQNQNEHVVVLLISGGISSRPGQQYLDMVNSAAGTGNELPLGDFGTTNFDIRKSIQKAVGALNRDNVTIYTISTRGQIDPIDEIVHSDRKYAPKNQKIYSEDYKLPLNQIARETGGLAFENSVNFKHGFDAILNDLSQQYLICYQAPEHDEEGEYHEIKVKSKVGGIKLRHRDGYVD